MKITWVQTGQEFSGETLSETHYLPRNLVSTGVG